MQSTQLALFCRANPGAAEWSAKQGRKDTEIEQPREQRDETYYNDHDASCSTNPHESPEDQCDACNNAADTTGSRCHEFYERIHFYFS